jgi:hypothetical protein
MDLPKLINILVDVFWWPMLLPKLYKQFVVHGKKKPMDAACAHEGLFKYVMWV